MDLLRVTVIKASLNGRRRREKMSNLSFKISPKNSKDVHYTSVPNNYTKGDSVVSIDESFLFNLQDPNSTAKKTSFMSMKPKKTSVENEVLGGVLSITAESRTTILSVVRNEVVGAAMVRTTQDGDWKPLQVDDVRVEQKELGQTSIIRDLDIVKGGKKKDQKQVGKVSLRFELMPVKPDHGKKLLKEFVQGESDSELDSDEEPIVANMKTRSGTVIQVNNSELQETKDDSNTNFEEIEARRQKEEEEKQKEKEKREIMDSIVIKDGAWQLQVHVIEVRDLVPVRA